MPILTTVGLLQGGLISDAARQKFVDDTNTLLLNGNGDFLFGALPDAVIFEGNGFLSDSFNIQPITKHQQTFPVWHQIFIDKMYQDTANALDIDGSTPLAPVLDYTVPFAGFGFPLRDLTLPEFAAGMAIPDPTFQAQLQFFFDIDIGDLNLDLLLQLPTLIPPPLPPLPPFPALPPLPLDFSFDLPLGFDLPTPQIPNLVLPPIPPIGFDLDIPTLPLPVIGFVLCAVVKAIPAIFAILLAKALAGELLTALSKGPVGLIIFVATVVIEAILSCLGINLKNVLTFLAGFLVYIKQLVLMLAVVLVGVVFGEGLLIQVAANAIGLI